MVLDQLVVSEEEGCWKPGCELLATMLRWICEIFAFETVCDQATACASLARCYARAHPLDPSFFACMRVRNPAPSFTPATVVSRHTCACELAASSDCKCAGASLLSSQAFDLLQSFPRFCGYRRNAYSQQRTCESLLMEFWPERMDFTRKRRLHMSWAGENKDYTRDEWLATLHQESRGKFEMEYRLWKRLICMTLPDVDRSTKEWDEASVEREATYRKQQCEAEQRQREEAEAKRRRIAEDTGRAIAAQNAENQQPNFGPSEFRRSRRPPS